MNKPTKSDDRATHDTSKTPKNAVEDQADVRARNEDQRQQPVPMEGDNTPTEYERPLPIPGDKDYVAGQPVDEAEAELTEAQVKERREDAEKRRRESERLHDQQQHQAQRGPHGSQHPGQGTAKRK